MGKKKRHHRIHREGRGIIVTLTFLIFAINVPIYLYMSNWIFAITLLLSAALLVFVTYFFRNPMRILEVSDSNLLIAPADGRVVVIEPTTENATSIQHINFLIVITIFQYPYLIIRLNKKKLSHFFRLYTNE